MEKSLFISIRDRLNKTQDQMAQLLGTSTQAIRSYEQGWRRIPVHIERHIFFLLAMKKRNHTHELCWIINDCPDEYKEKCPAWEFKAGDHCWLINGTFCKGATQTDWEEKMNICRTCKVITSLMEFWSPDSASLSIKLAGFAPLFLKSFYNNCKYKKRGEIFFLLFTVIEIPCQSRQLDLKTIIKYSSCSILVFNIEKKHESLKTSY